MVGRRLDEVVGPSRLQQEWLLTAGVNLNFCKKFINFLQKFIHFLHKFRWS